MFRVYCKLNYWYYKVFCWFKYIEFVSLLNFLGVNIFKNLMIYINLILEFFVDYDNLILIVIYFNKEKYNSFVYLYVFDFN